MSNYLGDLTWKEAEKSLSDEEIVIVPIGAFEQHGPHLPLDTDMRLASKIAELSAEAAREKGAKVLITPPIWAGYSAHHMDFCGTITMSTETLSAIIMETCECLAKHGFNRIFLLNGHGGNSGVIRVAVQKLFLEKGIRVTNCSYWDFAGAFIKEWRDSEPGGIDHACEMETSVLWYLFPNDVRQEEIKNHTWHPRNGYFSGDFGIGSKVGTCFSLKEINVNGVAGSPKCATPEKGKALVEYVVDQISEFLVYYGTMDIDEVIRDGLRD